MATPVKIIPTLHSEAARAFIERAEEHERNPRNIVIFNEKEEHAYIEMMKRIQLETSKAGHKHQEGTAAEILGAQKNSNKFGFSLAYSYLCMRNV